MFEVVLGLLLRLSLVFNLDCYLLKALYGVRRVDTELELRLVVALLVRRVWDGCHCAIHRLLLLLIL